MIFIAATAVVLIFILSITSTYCGKLENANIGKCLSKLFFN